MTEPRVVQSYAELEKRLVIIGLILPLCYNAQMSPEDPNPEQPKTPEAFPSQVEIKSIFVPFCLAKNTEN
jgi:hypothetical protein